MKIFNNPTVMFALGTVCFLLSLTVCNDCGFVIRGGLLAGQILFLVLQLKCSFSNKSDKKENENVESAT